jgi:hypothetical protein
MIGGLKASEAGDRQAACQRGHVIRLRAPSDISVSAYIPDMSCQNSKRVRHRQRQARYEARQRAGIALYPAPLGAGEIDTLVALGWLQEVL